VENASVNVATATLAVTYNPDIVSPQQLKEAVMKIGFDLIIDEDNSVQEQGESAITVEHVENNTSVRDMLGQRGIKPEDLPASEDIKKLERRVKREELRQRGEGFLTEMAKYLQQMKWYVQFL